MAQEAQEAQEARIAASALVAPDENMLVLESAQSWSQPSGQARDLVTALSSSSYSAELALGQDNPFQLVGATGDSMLVPAQNQNDVQDGVRSLLADALAGNGFSEGSVKAFQRLYEEQSNLPNASAESIARILNTVGAAINQRVAPELARDPSRRAEPIGMAVMQNPDGSTTFYMMLNRDDSALAQNRMDLFRGATNPNIIKLGPFTPGQRT